MFDNNASRIDISYRVPPFIASENLKALLLSLTIICFLSFFIIFSTQPSIFDSRLKFSVKSLEKSYSESRASLEMPK